MFKPQLVSEIKSELQAQGIEATAVAVKAHLNAFETVVVNALTNGEDVKLKGFVDFTQTAVEAREARNPQTGEKVLVPAHRKGKATIAKPLRKF